jgi:hypothetical protein
MDAETGKWRTPAVMEAAAEQSYQEAITVAKGQSAKLLNCAPPRALSTVARSRQARASPRSSRPVYGWFTKGFERPYLKDAKALLEEPT